MASTHLRPVLPLYLLGVLVALMAARLLAWVGMLEPMQRVAGWLVFGTLFCTLLWPLALFCALIWRGGEDRSARKEASAALRLGVARLGRVALLLPTRNDFVEEVAERLVEVGRRFKISDARFKSTAVFICDDSTQAECRSRIDAFVQRFPEEVTVARRNGHVGFKAGNLNHCLREIHRDFDWFLVCDADGLPDEDFFERLCNHVGGIPEEAWSRVAFVQTRQAGNPGQPGFGGLMGPAVEMHFDTLVQARAADPSGFVMFYGHGAVISTEAWRQVAQALGTEGQPQGLPEIVTEDLAFTLMCRKLRWHGVYAPEVTCYEDFPASYGQLRKRADKWIRGTGECLAWVWKKSRLANCAERIAQAPAKLSGAERFDIFIHAGQHALALPMLIFLILAGWYLPSEVKELRGQGFFLAPIPDGKNLVQYTLEWRYRTFWTWDFFLVMLFAIAMPFVPAVGRLWRNPRKLWCHLTTTVFLCHASLLAEALSVVVFLLSGRAHFRVTGDRQDGNSEGGIEGAVAKRRSLREWIGAYHPNAAWVFVAEILLGTWLFYTASNLKNLWVFGPACALLTSPLLHVLGWENRLDGC